MKELLAKLPFLLLLWSHSASQVLPEAATESDVSDAKGAAVTVAVAATLSSEDTIAEHNSSSFSQLQDTLPQHLPPPRFCILDDPTKTGEAFAETLKVLKRQIDEKKGALHDFLAYGRDRGHTALPGLKRHSSCPRFPLLKHADWACWLRRANGIFNMQMPFEKVQTIWLNQESAAVPAALEENMTEQVRAKERDWLHNGFLEGFHRCTKGCNCETKVMEQPTMCHINDLVRILNANEEDFRHKKGSITLVIGGHDNPKLHLVKEQAENWVKSGWFRRIFYEGTTVSVEGIDSYLKVFDQHYMLGREKTFLKAVMNADISTKPYLALASWGKRNGDTQHLRDAKRLDKFLAKLDDEFARDMEQAATNSSSPWISRKMFDVDEYFSELSKYKFLVAPKGGGLQSPKFLEALMVFTIPVTKRYTCFEQLKSYGMPLVLVDEWGQLNEDLLEKAWTYYEPILEKARWLGTWAGVESLYYGNCTA